MRITLLSCLSLLCMPLASVAIPITVPPDLNPGDQYRLVFVTSASRDATSTGIEVYNTFVTTAAMGVPELASLSTLWKAIGSTLAVNAITNTNTDFNTDTGVPMYNLNATRIADDNADLWDGTLKAPILYDELGFPGGGVWTGTLPDGITFLPLGDEAVLGGYAQAADAQWTADGYGTADGKWPLYAISGVITVAPEPSSISP